MKRIQLVVAYDGTNYCGWQIQPHVLTIEGVLNQTLESLLKEPITVIGASRTDSGVHALCNVAVFDTVTRIPPEKVAYALNAHLPEDIKIIESKEVDLQFHPRKVESQKTYQYRIQNTTFATPTHRFYTHLVPFPLQIDKMQEAANILVGEHDFCSFCNPRTQADETVRTIFRIEVKKQGDLVLIEVAGNGFLYHMVRIIAGTLIEVGKGRIDPQELLLMLDSRDRQVAGPTAPAKGLHLIDYFFVKKVEKA